jgi:tripartite-type tricarboxylate transporter receptor subunit TctC
MPMKRWCAIAAGAVAASFCFSAAPGRAQAVATYPDHPVRIIVPFAPAGPVDLVARVVAQKLTERLGKQFFVENQAGAGGNLGMGNGAKAAPNGYTILFVSSSFVVNPSLYPKVPYDPYRDFAPVTVAGSVPNALIVHPSLPATNLREFIDLIKANPGKYGYASAGIGTTPHLSGELLKLTAGIDLVHIPFGGAGPAIQSTVGGHTPIMFTTVTPAIPFIKAGALRGLAVAAKTRSAASPDIPTFEEAGLRDQEADTFVGVLVPAATPKEVVDLLHREIVASLRTPEVKARFDELAFDVVANSQDEFAAKIRSEVARWQKVITAAGIKAE